MIMKGEVRTLLGVKECTGQPRGAGEAVAAAPKDLLPGELLTTVGRGMPWTQASDCDSSSPSTL
jgi:hypothetical protein